MKDNKIEFIGTFGRKSKPFVKYCLKNNYFENDEFIWYNNLIYFWEGYYDKILKTYETYEFNSPAYLSYTYEMFIDIYRNIGNNSKMKETYTILKEFISSVSGYVREDLNNNLIYYDLYVLKDTKRIDNVRLEDFHNCIFSESLNSYYKSLAELIRGDFDMWLYYINHALELIKDGKRPSFEMMFLNSLAFNSLNFGKIKKASFYAKELAYMLGYWEDHEDFIFNLPQFYTLGLCLNKPRYLSLFSRIVKNTWKTRSEYYELAEKADSLSTEDIKNAFDEYYKILNSENINEIEIPFDIYISHLKYGLDNDTLLKEMKARVLHKDFTLEFEESRLTLVKKFLKHLSKDQKEAFKNIYLNYDLKSQYFIEKFVFNYSRYCDYMYFISDNFEIRDEYRYFEELNLYPQLCEICLCLFDEEEKEFVEDCFNNIIAIQYIK